MRFPFNHCVGMMVCSTLVAAGVSFALAGLAVPVGAFAQETKALAQPPLSDAEIKAKYQNCSGGWYSGPRPGKTRFAKDPWLWVVSAAFAQRFCMPPEFVSKDLKGAEAVAFRILKKSDDENCGFGGNPNACAGEVLLRFDVYIKTEVNLPRTHEGRYYQSSILPSAKLIGNAVRQHQFLRAQTLRKPESALKPHFEPQQVGLEGVKDGAVIWPVVALSLETHFGGVFEGIDYYAFEGSTGFFENPGIKQNKVTRFVLSFAELERDKFKPRTGQSLANYGHVIELPEEFTNRISEADRTRGPQVTAQLREAFGPQTNSPATTNK